MEEAQVAWGRGTGKAKAPEAPNPSVLDNLREDILRLSLPPSERLKFSELSARYKVSVGSLREALIELKAQGFVLSSINRGFTVRSMTSADLLDLTRTRIALEGMALREAVEAGGDSWEANILSALHLLSKVERDSIRRGSGPEGGWEERHRRFHDALLSGCRSPWILSFCSVLADHALRYRNLFRGVWPGSRNPHEEHQRIAHAALARDAPTAVEHLTEHYRRTANEIARRLDEAQ